jgi:regulator of replication initiation timing
MKNTNNAQNEEQCFTEYFRNLANKRIIKTTLVIITTIISTISLGQSKKDFIEVLTNRVDSLNTVLQTTRDNASAQITELNNTVDGLNAEISKLKQGFSELESSVSTLEKDKSELARENEKLKADLGEITKKNLESQVNENLREAITIDTSDIGWPELRVSNNPELEKLLNEYCNIIRNLMIYHIGEYDAIWQFDKVVQKKYAELKLKRPVPGDECSSNILLRYDKKGYYIVISAGCCCDFDYYDGKELFISYDDVNNQNLEDHWLRRSLDERNIYLQRYFDDPGREH